MNPMEKDIDRNEGITIRRHLLGDVVIALTLTVGVGGWATTTKLSGARIAHDERHVKGLVEPPELVQDPMVPERLAVIRCEHHQGA